ncbi:MAG: sigma-E factor negative regulatory protein [Burkholderiaceae bacterium]
MTHSVDDPNERRWQRLSALCDGEADPAEAQGAFDGWRDDPALRARWHSYQWIGDVMRSDDLASSVEHDQGFLLALRARLADEPVVFAPSRTAPPEPGALPLAAAGGAVASAARRVRWGAPAAMAAGVMVVAGALVVMRTPTAPAGAAPDIAAATAADKMADAGSAPADATVGPMLRNADLERYFEAHRQFARGPALAAPGAVRQVVVTTEGR